MSRWRAVVFDLDDTLFPEREYVLSGFRAVAEWAATELGVSATEGFGELRSLFERGVRGDTFDQWLAGRGLPGSHREEMVRVYRGHTPVIQPFPEVPGVLASLSKTHTLGLVSDGSLAVQRAKLDALGIGKWFKAVIFSDELGRQSWKPSPAPFREVLARLGVKPGEAVYVADNCDKDFIGARGAGLATIWARHSGGDYALKSPSSEAHAADFTISSLNELESVLR